MRLPSCVMVQIWSHCRGCVIDHPSCVCWCVCRHSSMKRSVADLYMSNLQRRALAAWRDVTARKVQMEVQRRQVCSCRAWCSSWPQSNVYAYTILLQLQTSGYPCHTSNAGCCNMLGLLLCRLCATITSALCPKPLLPGMRLCNCQLSNSSCCG